MPGGVALHTLHTSDICKTVKAGQSLSRNKSDDKKSGKLTNPSLYDNVIKSGASEVSGNLKSLHTGLPLIFGKVFSQQLNISDL